ncbi:MAG: DnaA/Hda family protein [Pseudomonadota bacterium]
MTTESPVIADRLNQQYRHGMLKIWNAGVAPVKSMSIKTRARLKPSSERAMRKAQAGGAAAATFFDTGRGPRTEARAQIGSSIDPLARLEGFAVDATNRTAYLAIERALNANGRGGVIYLSGPSGCGKTHLMCGLAHAWRERRPDDQIAYFSYADFREEVAPAARANKLQAVHKKLFACEALMIDDLHLLHGCRRTQEEILVLMDVFRTAGKQLIISGGVDTEELKERGISERLADRLAGGLPVVIEPAGDDLRIEILARHRAASDAQCILGDDILEFVARQFRRSIREAIGAMNQLLLEYGQEARQVSFDEARASLRPRLKTGVEAVTLEDLLAESATAFGLSHEEMVGRSQPQRIVRGRHAFNMIGRDSLTESFPRLAAVLRRDHTTIMSSYDRAHALHDRDAVFREKVAAIREALGLS